jgi:hypothetical protein
MLFINTLAWIFTVLSTLLIALIIYTIGKGEEDYTRRTWYFDRLLIAFIFAIVYCTWIFTH